MQMNQNSIVLGTQPAELARPVPFIPVARTRPQPAGPESGTAALRRARAEVIRQRTSETVAWAILALSALGVLWLSL